MQHLSISETVSVIHFLNKDQQEVIFKCSGTLPYGHHGNMVISYYDRFFFSAQLNGHTFPYKKPRECGHPLKSQKLASLIISPC